MGKRSKAAHDATWCKGVANTLINSVFLWDIDLGLNGGVPAYEQAADNVIRSFEDLAAIGCRFESGFGVVACF